MFGTRISVNVIAFVSSIILARLLTPTDFGLVGIALAVQSLIAGLLALSPAEALIRLPRFGRTHLNTSFTFQVLRGLILCAVMAALAVPIAYFYEDKRLAAILLVMGVTTIVGSCRNPALVIYLKRMKFWQEFLVQVPAKAASIVVAVAIAYLTGSYWALVIGTLAATATSVAASYLALPYLPAFTLRRFAVIWNFTKSLSIAEIVNTLNWRFDHFVIPAYLGPAMLGRYTMGAQLASLPVYELLRPLSQTLYPAFSGVKDLTRLREMFLKAEGSAFLLSFPASVGFALVAEPVVILMLGEEWRAAALVIQFAAPIFAIQSLDGPARAVAKALNRPEAVMNVALLNFAVRVPSVFIGIHFFGFIGVLAARCISGPFNAFQMLQIVRRELGLSFTQQFGTLARPAFATALMAVAVLALQHRLAEEGAGDILMLAASVACGITVFIPTLLLLWGLRGWCDGAERMILDTAKTAITPLRSQSYPRSS